MGEITVANGVCKRTYNRAQWYSCRFPISVGKIRFVWGVSLSGLKQICMYCVPPGASMLIGIKTRRHSYLSWLVVSFNPSEKYDFVSWDDYSQYIYIYGKIKFMVQTTSQYHTWRRTSQLGMNIETYPTHHAEMPKTQAHRHTRKREVSVLGISSHSNTFQNKASHVSDLKF